MESLLYTAGIACTLYCGAEVAGLLLRNRAAQSTATELHSGRPLTLRRDRRAGDRRGAKPRRPSHASPR